MESNNWRPAHGEPPSMEVPFSDWRSQLQPEARQKIVNKIMDTLKRHLPPVAGPEGMTELKKIAVRFEEKIYTAAVNQSDYLRKISLKMLAMETKSQQSTPMNPQLGVNQNSTDTAIPPQVNNQVQSLPHIPMVPSGKQQLLAQNLQNNTSASMQGISHSSGNNSFAQGTTTDIYANAQRHIQGRQQQQSQNQLLYQNQLQPQSGKQKIHNNALLQSSMQQQQQQSLLQANQLQPSQQSVMQMSSGLTSSDQSFQQSPATTIQSASHSALQQNQLNSIQQSVSSLHPQHVQAIARQSQQPQSSLHQQTNLPTQQQQQQLIGQQANMPNISNNQPSQLLGQQNNIVDIKQQHQQRLPVQQNNLINLQQSQQFLNQQSLSLHQQQLGQQNIMQGLQQQQQPQSQQQHQQQKQLLGSIQNISNMQSHERSMQLLQQPKNMPQTQQQLQQPSMSLLQSQGQQSPHLSSQQQLMSQFQSQTGQLQQPLAMQQQSNAMQREMQQRLQASGALLQPQNAIEQQKHFMQSQRGFPEVSSSTSMDSIAQTGHNGADWQEEIYQKIQSIKDAHLAELQEFHLKISQRYQQIEMLPHAKQSDTFEKLKSFKMLLECVLAFLQISKNSITVGLKEKLPMYEKQIISLLNSNKRQKVMPLQQQVQHPGGHAQSTPQHQQSQVLQAQQHENHGNQLHQINMQSAVTSSMQNASMTLPCLAAPATQQNSTSSVQSASELDPVQVNSFGSLQQGSMSSVQQSGVRPLQNSVSAAQQSNLNNLSESSLSGLQPNETLMQNSNVLQQQQLKQQQEHLMQNQQLKQQLQQRQIQQQLFQQQQRQQLLQPHQPLQQQQSLLQQVHLQQKQQQPSQLPVHQMSQLHPMNELNELKVRQGSGIKSGIYQQPIAGVQRHNNYHQQLKPGASFPNSSPQNMQAASPQISHHSSPQIDQHALLPTLTKPGTPLQSTSSHCVVPSPSNPISPSPIPGDSEKLVSTAVSLSTTGQTTHQHAASAPLQSQLIAVATPGISASPLLAEFTSQEGILSNATTASLASSVRPLERLIKAVQSLSRKALSSAVSDISSVVSMIDRIAGSAPGNGSRAAVGEDLVAMTRCRLQARNFMSQDGGATSKKMKRHTSAMPINNVSSAGSVNDNFMKFGSLDSSELESTATSHVKRNKLEANHALQEEIREINNLLIDTMVSICNEDSDSVVTASEAGGEGTIVKCSFSAVTFSPNLKAHFASMHMSPISPLRLLVPTNYPKCSPLLLDKLPIEPSKEFEDLSIKAKSRFSISLRSLSQPMSLVEMAGTWDACARKVIVEYAQQIGGGSFSSTYGAWENCVGA